MAKMKKGVLLTLGITMLVTIVFSLAVLLFHNTQSMENRFSELALFDRISDCDGMVQSNIRDINTYESGLYITVGTKTVDTNNVNFTEAFPRSQYFKVVMGEYEDYMKTNYTAANITFDKANMDKIKDYQVMYIMPYGILYEHDRGFYGSGDLVESESYTINPGTSTDILGYTIKITVNADSVALGSSSVGINPDLPINIDIRTEGGGSFYAAEWEIDHDDSNTLTINLYNLGNPLPIGTVTIKAGDTGDCNSYCLDVDPPTGLTKTSILDIILTEPGSQEGPVEVKYDPEGIFTIHLEEAKLLKKGTVKLA